MAQSRETKRIGGERREGDRGTPERKRETAVGGPMAPRELSLVSPLFSAPRFGATTPPILVDNQITFLSHCKYDRCVFRSCSREDGARETFESRLGLEIGLKVAARLIETARSETRCILDR